MTKNNPAEASAADAWVDAAYEALARDPLFIRRESQVDFSKGIAHSLLAQDVFLGEAPTGTGKTLGYMVGALAASAVRRTMQPTTFPDGVPLVIATATKALQSQLFNKDLPALEKALLVLPGAAQLAKGKNNYLCLTQAEEVLQMLEMTTDDVFVDEASADLKAADLQTLIEAARNFTWNGDFDDWKGSELPKDRRSITVATETCRGNKCPDYKECPYFRMRGKWKGASILVANHDLVLRDLQAVQIDVQVFPIKDYYAVFDEGHHLPEKAIQLGERTANIGLLLRNLTKLMGIERILSKNLELLSKLETTQPAFARVELGKALDELAMELEGQAVGEDSHEYRYSRGRVPASLAEKLKSAYAVMGPIYGVLDDLLKRLKEKIPGMSGPLEEKAKDLNRRILDFYYSFKSAYECFAAFLEFADYVKWLYRLDDRLTLTASPIEGAEVLKPLLWNQKRVRAPALVSATLRDIDGFSRFEARAGVPKDRVRTMVVESTFPYNQSKLIVRGMKHSPKAEERLKYLQELQLKLPADIDRNEGTLVLFTSWRMVKEFAPILRRHFGDDAVQVQGEKALPFVIAAHVARIGQGKGSILLGTASLAEGLDLPGELCTHVCIGSLPFPMPGTPLEEERQERMGRDYFQKYSLPDAMTRLMQWVGRLLRRESDRGRITLYDNRLGTMQYGRKMLALLPPFEKIVEPIDKAA